MASVWACGGGALSKVGCFLKGIHLLLLCDNTDLSFSFSEYADAKEMIPRNTSVIVSRVPLAASQRIPKAKYVSASASPT